jgi:hypothetical protein
MAQVYEFNRFTAKTEITEVIKQLNEQEFENEAQRIEEADAVIEAYVQATGERPNGTALNDLGTFILKEYYDSEDRNKKEQPNPILSEHQYVRRIKKERSGKFAENYGADGKNHNPATRTHSKY